MGHVLHLIAKVKWECDNDSADREQLREASQHWRFLDADTFLIQKASQWLQSDYFTAENEFPPSVWRTRRYMEPVEADSRYQIMHR